MFDLSWSLHDLGTREEALGVQIFCVIFYRGLVQQHRQSPESLFRLALSLNNLSQQLADVGRLEEGLQTNQEAVEIHQRLVEDHFRTHLATSLDNLSLRLSDVGRGEEALLAVEETVELRWQISNENCSDVSDTDLACSLNNLLFVLCELGRPENALKPIEQAVALQRQLVSKRPAAFKPRLANYLDSLSTCLTGIGR